MHLSMRDNLCHPPPVIEAAQGFQSLPQLLEHAGGGGVLDTELLLKAQTGALST